MSWLALNDFRDPRVATGGLTPAGTARPDDPGLSDPNAMLTNGTLVIEALHPGAGPSNVISFASDLPWPVSVTLTLYPEGRAVLAIRQGISDLGLETWYSAHTNMALRITFRWSTQHHSAWLAVETPEDRSGFVARRDGPLPIPVAALLELMARTDAPCWSPDTRMAALSDRLEPLGLRPGFTAGTPVATPTGWRAVETLRPGDLVLTQDAGPQPLRHIGRRDVPALGGFAPVRLRSPYLGLGRDLMVSPRQRVLVTGEDVSYALGCEEVLAQARHLTATGAARIERPAWQVRYYDLALDRAHLIQAGGGSFEVCAARPGPVARHRLSEAEALVLQRSRAA